jgi:hypothetical protein
MFHTDDWACVWLRRYGWKVSDHIPYSPDCVLNDFYRFGPRKKRLAGKHFEADADV